MSLARRTAATLALMALSGSAGAAIDLVGGVPRDSAVSGAADAPSPGVGAPPRPSGSIPPPQPPPGKTVERDGWQSGMVPWGLTVGEVLLLAGLIWVARGRHRPEPPGQRMPGVDERDRRAASGEFAEAGAYDEAVDSLQIQLDTLRRDVDALERDRRPSRQYLSFGQQSASREPDPAQKLNKTSESVPQPRVVGKPYEVLPERNAVLQPAQPASAETPEAIEVPGFDTDLFQTTFNLLAADRQAEQFAEFEAAWAPTAYRHAGGNQFVPDPNGYFWVVQTVHGRGVIVPGRDAVKNWSTGYRALAGQIARERLGEAYELKVGTGLRLEQLAEVRIDDAGCFLLSQGSLSGIA